jgi:hypothetical protein
MSQKVCKQGFIALTHENKSVEHRPGTMKRRTTILLTNQSSYKSISSWITLYSIGLQTTNFHSWLLSFNILPEPVVWTESSVSVTESVATSALLYNSCYFIQRQCNGQLRKTYDIKRRTTHEAYGHIIQMSQSLRGKQCRRFGVRSIVTWERCKPSLNFDLSPEYNKYTERNHDTY